MNLKTRFIRHVLFSVESRFEFVRLPIKKKVRVRNEWEDLEETVGNGDRKSVV